MGKCKDYFRFGEKFLIRAAMRQKLEAHAGMLYDITNIKRD